MKSIILDNINKYKLIERGDRILIGLSGGPDSVFLFHMLYGLMDELEFSLYLAHVNHGIRGEDADRDQVFVENIAREYDLPFYLKKADMYGYAREHNLSSEEAGREIRYGFFNEILEEIGGGKIAVGHNKSDQVETMLMRFFRGTGLDGLRGMDYKINNIIRPILNIDRESLEKYLDDRELPYVIDKTNLETIYNRNKIRLETVPHIEENYNPNLIETLFRTSDNLKEDSDFLRDYSSEAFDRIAVKSKDFYLLDREAFLREHRSIRSRIIRLCIEDIKGNLQGVGQNHIYDSLDFIDRGDSGKSIDLMDNINIVLSYSHIKIGRNLVNLREEFSYSLDSKKLSIEDLGVEISLDIIDAEKIEDFNKNKYIKYFDYDKINGELQMRNRRDGDSFKPLGMKGSNKKVKDFFIDEKVPRDERDKVLILSDDSNIIWIVGYRISDDYKITKETKKVLEVKISRRISNG